MHSNPLKIKSYQKMLLKSMIFVCLITRAFIATAQTYEWSNISTEPSYVLPDISLEQLNAVPDVVTIDGREYYLTVYLSRDYMPIIPPGGKPLYTTIYFKSRDDQPIGSSLSVVAFWLVRSNFIWKDWILEDTLEPAKPGQIKLRHMTGPRLEPNTYIDVIAMVRDLSGKTFFLKAPKQFIRKTS